jgi:hypothetical protein
LEGVTTTFLIHLTIKIARKLKTENQNRPQYKNTLKKSIPIFQEGVLFDFLDA